MKSLFYSLLLLLPATNSIAQTQISDTSKATVQNGSSTTENIKIRDARGDRYYYIDGIKVRANTNLPKKRSRK